METEALFIEPKPSTRIPDEAKRQLVLEFRRSGMKMKDWCSIRGIGYSTFKRWIYKQRIGAPDPTNKSGSISTTPSASWSRVEIESSVSKQPNSSASSAIRIDTGTISIHLPYETPTELLKTILLEVISR